MINFDEALSIVIKESKILGVEKRDILAAINRVLAEDIYSKDNLPPFDKSAMDGYAIKSEDTQKSNGENAIKLKVKGVIKAGDYCEDELKVGEAFKIMTGTALPKGADAVIEIEKVNVQGDEVFIGEKIKIYNNIIKFGEEVKVGQLALSKGKVIRPVEVGLLASLGYSSVKVYRDPVIALIITGDELVDIDSKLENGKIRNSNEYSLKALIKNLNAEVLSLGIVPDKKDILREKIKYALEKADVVISSGGASVGEYDFVEEILIDIGSLIKFNKVAIKPGKPVTFATYKEKLFFALPGNPMALINTFEELVKPAIEKIQGKDNLNNKEFSVVLADDFKGKKGRIKYVYVEIKKEKDIYYAHKIGSQCSNHLMTISKANGLIIIPQECGDVKAGDVFNGKYMFK